MAEQTEFINAGSANQTGASASPGSTHNEQLYFSPFTFKLTEEIREEQEKQIPVIRARFNKALDTLRWHYSNIIAKYCEARKSTAIAAGLTHFTILLDDIIGITIGKHAKYSYPMIKFLDDIEDVYDENIMLDIYDYHIAIKLIQPYIDVMTGLEFTAKHTNHPVLPGCYSAVTIRW